MRMVGKRIIAAVAGLGLLGAVLLGVLATVGHASAAPAPQAQTPTTGAVAWANGQITALQKDGFTIQDRNQQTTTVTVDANTWIVVDKNNTPTQGALADLVVGDNVSVGGVASGTNTIAARVVQSG